MIFIYVVEIKDFISCIVVIFLLVLLLEYFKEFLKILYVLLMLFFFEIGGIFFRFKVFLYFLEIREFI